MSLDGTPIVISKDIKGSEPITKRVECGGELYLSTAGVFGTCALGHVHCRSCGRIAKRFRSSFTCNHSEK